MFEVFARKTRGEPLRHIGDINALTSELARVCAWKTYDEQNWFEMCVVPRECMLPVNLSEGPFSVAHAGKSAASGPAGPAQPANREVTR